MSQIATILADWGTTNLRAFALDGEGVVVDVREAPMGLRNVPDRNFAAIFDKVMGDWRAGGSVPTLLCGMIGSRQGWIETPYRQCPVTLDDLARALTPVPDRDNVWIVPGLCLPHGGPRRDVMRGEEVQVFGALALAGIDTASLCLPGTHSKWVHAEAGTITRFATAMTGETFAVMSAHSILGALMDEADTFSSAAFESGLDLSGEPGGLLHHLFSVRVDGLFDVFPRDQLRSFLSGILVGHEMRELSHMFPAGRGDILLVGAINLCRPYGEAFDRLGVAYRAVRGEEAVLKGLSMILDRAGPQTGNRRAR